MLDVIVSVVLLNNVINGSSYQQPYTVGYNGPADSYVSRDYQVMTPGVEGVVYPTPSIVRGGKEIYQYDAVYAKDATYYGAYADDVAVKKYVRDTVGYVGQYVSAGVSVYPTYSDVATYAPAGKLYQEEA